MKEEKEKIWEETSSFQAKLKELLDMRPFNNVRAGIAKAVSERHLAMTLFHDVATETTLLCQEHQNLLIFLTVLLTMPLSYGGKESIQDVAYQASNFVEACVVDNQVEHAFTEFKNDPYVYETGVCKTSRDTGQKDFPCRRYSSMFAADFEKSLAFRERN